MRGLVVTFLLGLTSLVLAPATGARGGTYEIIKAGVEKKATGGSKAVAADEVVTVGPYDRILIAIWTRNAGERHDYHLKDELTLTIAGETPEGIYKKGYAWVRATDWDGERGNPDTDSAGNPAWSYHFIPFGRGGLDSGVPWYAEALKRLTKFAGESWREPHDPRVFRDRLCHLAWWSVRNNGYPVVQWRNPTGRKLDLHVTGRIVLEWLNLGADDVHYAIVHVKVSHRKPSVVWKADARARNVVAVFPHPTVPARVVVSTASGLVASADNGRTWRPIENTGPGRLGEVNCVAFSPEAPDVFYVASDTEGVWSTDDGGRTLRRIGSGQNGLIDDSVLKIYVYPFDSRFRTLLAVHGDAAPGISRSEDGGRTWRPVTEGFRVHGLVFGRSTLLSNYYMAAARKETPDVQSIWSSPGLGDYWFEIMRDVIPTDAATSILDGTVSYWATADAGLYRLRSSWAAVKPERISPQYAGRGMRDWWASVGVVLGARPGTETVFAYEPRKLGLVTSEDGMQTFRSHKRGLFVGPYVREGAHVRANANGTAFFAAVNGRLYTGRPRVGGFGVADVDVDPPAISYARHAYVGAWHRLFENMQAMGRERSAAAVARRMLGDIDLLGRAFEPVSLTISARIESGGGPPAEVTVDLSPLGGAAATPMRDDGRHGDCAPGDGVYAARRVVSARDIIRDGRNSNRDVRGRLGLWVAAGAGAGAEAPVSVPGIFLACRRTESFVFWNEKDPGVYETEGEVSVETDSTPGAARQGQDAVRIAAGPGRWLVSLGRWHRKFDVTGYHALTFWVRRDAGAPGDLNVHLCDFPENSMPVVTPPVPVEFGAGAAGDEYRLAVVPLARLREGEGSPRGHAAGSFQPNLTAFVVFSGEVGTTALSARPGEAGGKTVHWIDDILFHATGEDLERYRAEAEKSGAGEAGSR